MTSTTQQRVTTIGDAMLAVSAAIAEGLTFSVEPVPTGGVEVTIDADGWLAVCLDPEADTAEFIATVERDCS